MTEPKDDVVARVRAAQARARIKRFYKKVSTALDDASWVVHLDGRSVKTPLKKTLAVPTHVLAEAVAEEWAAQEEHVEPEAMPLTKLAGTAVDKICGTEREEVIATLLTHVDNDLLIYRAEHPDSLVKRQSEIWGSIVADFQSRTHTRVTVVSGIMPAQQPREVHNALQAEFEALDDWALTAAQACAASTGSLLLALALTNASLGAQSLIEAAVLDEDWQMDRWGQDAEAVDRQQRLATEIKAAARFFSLSRP